MIDLSPTPQTIAEWQQVVNLAEACQLIDAGRRYGMITGGPVVDLDRCYELLAAGARLRIRPERAAVDAMIRSLV